MRPKRKILLIDPLAGTDRASTWPMMLRNWGYDVCTATPQEAPRVFGLDAFRCAVYVEEGSPRNPQGCIDELRQIAPSLKSVLLSPRRTKLSEGLIADAHLVGGFSAAELRERLEILSALQRGPKPATPRRAAWSAA